MSSNPRRYTWDEARRYCEHLQLAGKGWRLPTLPELLSIVVPGNRPTIDSRAFPDTPARDFWTSLHYVGAPAYVYVVYFAGEGSIVGSSISKSLVRCVRTDSERP